ncbi:MAG TPA: SDR family NAD(P)-dependent oxidoreductase, partial [Pyrinomonadaceae bacterium]|nr:SDR family NAD(P)-dependent oxidoreductase [Pyrinomonadaceae bacterium]
MSDDWGMELKGRVALVSGGSRGIGRALVERLAEAGTHVAFNYERAEGAAAEAVRVAQARGVR